MSTIGTWAGRILVGASAALVLLVSEVRAEVMAYDANGTLLGELMDFSMATENGEGVTGVKLFLPTLSRYALIDSSTGNLAAPGAKLWFAGWACRGEPFVEEDLYFSLAPLNGRIWTGQSTAPMSLTAQSYYTLDSMGNTVCIEHAGGKKIVVVPAISVDRLDFDLPVALPLSFQQ